jgi:hypothetical protein
MDKGEMGVWEVGDGAGTWVGGSTLTGSSSGTPDVHNSRQPTHYLHRAITRAIIIPYHKTT